MLCSDGFRHKLTMEEMQEYLLYAVRRKPLQMKRQEEILIEFNKQRGETDNISVITIYAD